MIAFTQSWYSVQENMTFFQLCTVIESGLISPRLLYPISVGITYLEGNATGTQINRAAIIFKYACILHVNLIEQSSWISWKLSNL